MSSSRLKIGSRYNSLRSFPSPVALWDSQPLPSRFFSAFPCQPWAPNLSSLTFWSLLSSTHQDWCSAGLSAIRLIKRQIDPGCSRLWPGWRLSQCYDSANSSRPSPYAHLSQSALTSSSSFAQHAFKWTLSLHCLSKALHCAVQCTWLAKSLRIPWWSPDAAVPLCLTLCLQSHL